jgi:hypothetical protein
VTNGGATSVALATPADDAEPLVQEGIAFRSSFRDAEALDKFRRAYEIARTPRIKAQIGAAEQALGRWVEAETHILEALTATKDVWIIKNRPTLETALSAVRSHIGNLEILGKPSGAEVRIDGELVGRLPLAAPLHLPAGRTTLDVRAPGHFPAMRTVSIEAEKLTRETIVLRAEEVGPAAATAGTPAAGSGTDATRGPAKPENETKAEEQAGPPPPKPPEGDTGPRTDATGIGWRRPAEFAAAGAAAIGLVLGIVEHLKWQDKISSFGSMSACGSTLADRGGPGCQQLYSDGQSAKTLALVGYGAAAAFGAAAAILYFTEPARGVAAQTVACAPTTSARGVDCAVRF